MSEDYFKRVDLLKLYRPLAAKVQRLQAALLAAGATFWATSGFRSLDEQAQLYALGRTVPNHDASPQKPMGSTVTNAKPGQSYHNWGLALDFTADSSPEPGLQPTWTPQAYDLLVKMAPQFGLEAGGSWVSFKDLPHVQLPLARVGLSLADVQRAHAKGGYPAVWALLDKYNW